jgi:hypothetical protein
VLLGVDVGGTFTDAVLVGADSSVHTAKVPSTPEEQSAGALEHEGDRGEHAGARAGQVERFAHGMTVATNALLEGRTARTASSTPTDCSPGVEGTLAVWRAPSAPRSTASVKVPPTSTPRSMHADYAAASSRSSVSARCWCEGQ